MASDQGSGFEWRRVEVDADDSVAVDWPTTTDGRFN
jgi:hypothetical protein